MSIPQGVGEAASPVTYAASGVALVAGVTLNEWLAIVSICVAIGSFGLNWYYKHAQLKVLRKDKK